MKMTLHTHHPRHPNSTKSLLLKKEILKSTKEQSMKGSDSLAHNVTYDLLKRDILKSTKEQSMKGSNSLAHNVKKIY